LTPISHLLRSATSGAGSHAHDRTASGLT